MTQLTGVDVYEGDGSIDFTQVAKSNHFVIQKISEGTTFIDPTATRARVDAIRKNQMISGGYHFLRPKRGRTGADEMRVFLDHGRSIGLWARDGQRIVDIRPVIDVEVTGDFDANTIAGRLAIKRYVVSAVKEVIAQTGHRPIIYTGGPFWRDTARINTSWGCPLWLAAYTHSPEPWTPPYWKKASLWQYTDQKTVPGILRPCDHNVYTNGDAKRFRMELCF